MSDDATVNHYDGPDDLDAALSEVLRYLAAQPYPNNYKDTNYVKLQLMNVDGAERENRIKSFWNIMQECKTARDADK